MRKFVSKGDSKVSELQWGWQRGNWREGGKKRLQCRAQAGKEDEAGEKMDYKSYEALMRGGEEVISMMKEMLELVSLQSSTTCNSPLLACL